jgi:four helix bundle protein
MGSIRSFEELRVWQRSRALAQAIFEETQVAPFDRDFPLRDQINRAMGSVMDNIAEGFERDGVREFVQFLSVAKGSAGEVRSQLYRAKDRGYISDNFDKLSNDISEVSRQLQNFIFYLKQTGFKGTKYFDKPPDPPPYP